MLQYLTTVKCQCFKMKNSTIFLIFCSKQRLWVHLTTASLRFYGIQQPIKKPKAFLSCLNIKICHNLQITFLIEEQSDQGLEFLNPKFQASSHLQ